MLNIDLLNSQLGVFKTFKLGAIIWWHNLKKTMPLAIVYVFFPLIIFELREPKIIPKMGWLEGIMQYKAYWLPILVFIAPIIAFILIVSIIYIFDQLAAHKHRANFSQVLKFLYQKAYILFLLLLVIGIGLSLFVILGGLVAWLHFSISNWLSINSSINSFVILCLFILILTLICLFILTIWIYIFFTPYIIITTGETKIKHAIKSSMQLIKGNFWYIVGVIVAIYLICGGLYLFALGLVKLVVVVWKSSTERSLLSKNFILIFNMLLFIVLQALNFLFGSAVKLAMFYELQKRHKRNTRQPALRSS